MVKIVIMKIVIISMKTFNHVILKILIFGVVYAGYSVVSLAFNTKARVWGMTRDFIEEGMNVFSGDALQDGVQEISRRAFNAIDKMSRKYE